LVVFTDEAFGAKLLEAITAGLYDGNLNCLREYVQNSIDSKADRVNIRFENNQTVLVIEDNGCGMDRQELEEALHLGKSGKPDTSIGWRGIGIWSGIPACRRIVIVTKKKSHPKLRVEIDADGLRQQYVLSIPATEVLTEVTGDIEELEMGSGESIQDLNFTMIRLEELLPNQRTIFIEEEIRNYLSGNLPVPFDTSKFTMGKEIDKRLRQHGVETNEVDIFFESKRVFRPPDTDDIFFRIIIEKEFIVEDEPVAYGWLLTSKDNRKLRAPNRGICFKKKGITIGDETLVAKQHGGVYNQWQYGEIHITTDALKENAPRNNFEANNDIIDPFYKQVGDFVAQLQQMNRYQSNRVVRRQIEEIRKHIDNDEMRPARDKVTRMEKRLQRSRSYPKESALQEMKKTIDKESRGNKISLKALKRKIEEKPQDRISIRKDRFNEFAGTSHPLLKKHLGKTTKKGRMELDIDAMDPVKTLLKQKTGLKLDAHELSKRAYDWKEIVKGDNGPMLCLPDECPQNIYRGRLFGVMIQALRELFLNPSKHEKGRSSFSYYESMTEEERIDTLMEFHMAQNLMLRLIEKSKRMRNP